MQNEVLRCRLAAAYHFFAEHGHQQNMNRVRELAEKLTSGEYGIAFAGHFSAGKSRMINNLLGENILPSSPVPTSANLVRVHRGMDGEDYARVFFHRERPRRYLAPYDYDMIRSFCRDGDQIAEIELCRSGLDLEPQVVIMDTPGIDSADDAHRAATEAALHLADVILYVMDYNHVQAELNLAFTRDLTQAGKTVYLIVNQIDKHQEGELPFADFCRGVENAFHTWGVQPAGFFYTSLKYPDYPHNQFPALKQLLEEKIAGRHALLAESVAASLKKIMTEYRQEKEQERQEGLAAAYEVLAGLSDEGLSQMKGDYLRLRDELAELHQDWEEEFSAGVEAILANAYLMPTATRDLARDYLEACQPDFKVGFFGRGKKTLAAIERRRLAFFEDAAEKARTQLEWHIKTYFTDFARGQHVDSGELTAYIQAMAILPPEELLTEAMRSGAKLTQDGSYVMNYTANFAEGTKNVARKFALEFKERLRRQVAIRRQERCQEIENQLAAMERYHGAWQAVDRAAENRRELAAALAELDRVSSMTPEWEELFVTRALDEEIVQPQLVPDGALEVCHAGHVCNAEPEMALEKGEKADKAEKAERAAGRAGAADAANLADAADAGDVDAVKFTADTDDTNGKGDSRDNRDNKGSKSGTDGGSGKNAGVKQGREALRSWADKLRRGSELIGRIPVLQQLAGELLERAERLEGRGFMVTLFGAFSAGKSSFANALLGGALLPVSPNPTTAAINKICSVDEEHLHGTVLVKLKDEAMLLEDVNRALSAFQLSAGSIREAVPLVEKALKAVQDQDDDLNSCQSGCQNGCQREKAFLRAFLAGWQEATGNLGQQLVRKLEDFCVYAAQEEKSCFVEWLAVYYDCPFTRLGITLVDTPGADSINARHTNMSFNYIRQSDVVLFITYYNHAFSRADREFLIQLGRVKDAFALDKMFFIVNAIDLAEDDEEAAGVVSYVAAQLKKYGVRNPQMFGLSSQQVLRDKLAGRTTGFAFEEAFYRFVLEELTGIAVNAAQGEYRLAVERVRELIRLNRSDTAEKDRRRRQLLEFKRRTDALLDSLTSLDMQNSQQQEARELVYYVKQRVFLRYTDFYREAFNPALFKGRENASGKLQDALKQLLASLGFDLAQELRATTLRMEQFMQKQAGLLQQQVNSKLLEIDSELPISPREFSYESGMEYESAFKDVDRRVFDRALSIYKNPKSFFEQGGSKEMAAALEKIFDKLADDYLGQQEQRLLANLHSGTEQVFSRLKARFQRLLQADYEANIAALEGGVPVAELEDIFAALQDDTIG